jgi:hypothetical protein
MNNQILLSETTHSDKYGSMFVRVTYDVVFQTYDVYIREIENHCGQREAYGSGSYLHSALQDARRDGIEHGMAPGYLVRMLDCAETQADVVADSIDM